MKGASIVAVFGPYVGAFRDQESSYVSLPGISCNDQRRSAVVILLVNRGAFGDQPLDLLNASTLRRIVNLARPGEGGQAKCRKN